MHELLWAALAVAMGLLLWFVARRFVALRANAAPQAKRQDALDTLASWPPLATRVLTFPERRAYMMLTQVLPEHIVLAHVPVSRFIRVPTRNSYQAWMRRVGQLCADLVVCDKASQVIAVVELRGPPQQESERSRKRHERMDKVLRKAGVRVLTWNQDALPSIDVVREQVLRATGQTGPGPFDALPPSQTGLPYPAPAATPPLAPAPPRAEALASADGGPKHRLDTLLAQADAQTDADVSEPTPSTYFDDLDSAPTPLDPKKR